MRPCAINHKRSRQRGDSAIIAANFVRGHRHTIVDAGLQNESTNLVRIVFVGCQRDDFKFIGIAFLQIDQVGNFRAARPAPGGPEIQQHDLALGIRQRHRFAIQILQLKRGSRIRILDEPHDIFFRSVLFCRRQFRRRGLRVPASREKQNADRQREELVVSRLFHRLLNCSAATPDVGESSKITPGCTGASPPQPLK